MRIAIGSDKSGWTLKEAIKAYLTSEDGKAFMKAQSVDIEVVDDLGTTELCDVHPYYRAASDVASKLQNGEYDRAILICGTGAGMSVVANKYKGIQAIACESRYSAKMARAINNAQIMCMGGWIIAPEMGVEMAKDFLTTDYLQDLEEWRKEWLTNAAAKVVELENKLYR